MTQTHISETDQQAQSPKVHKLRRSRNATTESMHCEATLNTKGLYFLGALIFCQLPCRTTFEKVRHFTRLTMVAE